MKRKTVFLLKKVWKDFLDGREKNLETLAEGELRYWLGDNPEKYVVEVEISEVSKDDTCSMGVPFNP
jgi:hypothetical protein